MKIKIATLLIAMMLFMYPAAHAETMSIGDSSIVLDEDGYKCGRIIYTGSRSFTILCSNGHAGYSIPFNNVPDGEIIANLPRDYMKVNFKMNNFHSSVIDATCKDK